MMFFSKAAVPPPFWQQASVLTVQCLGQIVLVLYLIYRSGERLTRFGLRRWQTRRDLGWGVGLLVLGMIGYYAAYYLYVVLSQRLHWSLARPNVSMLSMPAGGLDFALLLAMCIANGIREELIVRAYLIPRLEQLLGSTAAALLLSTILFVSYHSYQGLTGMIGVCGIGLIYGGAFCLLRRFWPLAIAHGLQDFVSFAWHAR
jgi:membrane protease YdiL (CAAX protease family)